MTATLTPPTSTDRGEGAPPPAPPARPAGRSAFEVFVAIVAAVALVAGMYAFGRALADDDAGPGAATGGGDAAAGGTETTGADGAGTATDHGDHGEHAEVVDDRGFAALENGEQHGHHFTQALTPEERAELARQLELARDVALRYPTVADAEAAGLRRAGPFSPGLGSHYMNPNAAAGLNPDGVMDDEDIHNPIAWIYDGVDPDSRIAGLFYMSVKEDVPEGFAGPNDIWHTHSSICIVPREGGGIDTPLGADREIAKEECDAVGGSLIQQTQWLLHVWPVPGYESPEGVFSHLSSAVTCKDGTYYTIPLDARIGNVSSVCRDAN